jgi:uncharacterized protein (UPF0254 family)
MAQAPQQTFDARLMKVASMLPTIPNNDEGQAMLARLVTHPQFGALALTEISRRDRADTIRKAQESAGGGNIADAMVAKMMANQMQERLAADERFGLNNIVSQAEQGAIDFGGGEPEMQAEPMDMAGGGMIAFEEGGRIKQTQDGKRYFDDEELGRVYEDGSLGYAAAGLIPAVAGIASRFSPAAYRASQIGPQLPKAAGAADAALKKGAGALGVGSARLGKGAFNFIRNNPITSGLSGLGALPFMFGGEEEPEGSPVSDTYPEEFERGSAKDAAKVADLAEAAQGAKNEKEAARGIADLLGGNTTASDILKERRRLEEEAGLGEYGAGVKEKQTKRRAETEEKFGKEKTVQALLGAAEAAGGGGKRLTGLGALAAAVSGGGKGALSVMKEERAALEKISDAEEKMAMAEELYKRGDIASAQKMAADAQQQQQENVLKLRQLQIQERALTAKSAGKFAIPQTILAKIQQEYADVEREFSAGQIDEAEYQRRLASIAQRERNTIALSLLGGAERTERD